jgi:hypothetical protein
MFHANCSPTTRTSSGFCDAGGRDVHRYQIGMENPMSSTSSTTATPASRYVERCERTPT